MRKVIDLTGQTFGKLTVLRQGESVGGVRKRIAWVCKCTCGNEKTIAGKDLKAGGTKSCASKECMTRIKIEDLTGQRFGRLFVLFAGEKRGNFYKRPTWVCKCDCGNEKTILHTSLKSNKTKSCGCIKKEMMTTHGMTKSPIYRIWNALVQRCTNKNNHSYSEYGGRGITVCKRWENSFENFYEDMGDKPDSLTLDRIDNNKGYSPDNCRWTTRVQQSINQRPRKRINNLPRGVSMKRTRFYCEIKVNYKKISLGAYATLEEAIKVRRDAELKYFGEYCPTE